MRRVLAILLCALALPSLAQPMGGAVMEGPLRDPWLPPHLRKLARPPEEASRGAQLRVEVEARLRANFDAAAGPGGTLTRAQAKAGGLGFVAQHFDAIDRAGRGTVSFDDYKRFLKERGAALD